MSTEFKNLSKLKKEGRKTKLKFMDVRTFADYEGRSLSFAGLSAERMNHPFEALGQLMDNLASHFKNIDWLFRNRIIGVLKEMTATRFATAGADVGGWPELSEMRIKQREEGGSINNPEQPIMRDTLLLEKSFEGRVSRLVTGAELVWGSPLEHAPLLEFGGENEEGFYVPPRTMVAPNDEHLMVIYDRLESYLTKFLRQPWDPKAALQQVEDKVPF